MIKIIKQRDKKQRKRLLCISKPLQEQKRLIAMHTPHKNSEKKAVIHNKNKANTAVHIC